MRQSEWRAYLDRVCTAADNNAKAMRDAANAVRYSARPDKSFVAMRQVVNQSISHMGRECHMATQELPELEE